jgi:hypothetical protein
MFVVMQRKSSSHSPAANRETGPTVSPPEKIAAKLARYLQQNTFSESGSARNMQNCWHFRSFWGEDAEFLWS